MLHKLLDTKYHIYLVPGALSLFLIKVQNQMEQIEMDIAYERLKKRILLKHPNTVEQIIDVFLDEFDTPSSKKKAFLVKLFNEHGLNYSLHDIDRFCHHRENAQELIRFERSLNWKPTTFADIDNMTGFEFEDFIVDLFKKLGYVVEKRKRSREQGLDLLLFKHGVRIAVQVKRYRRHVGNRAV